MKKSSIFWVLWVLLGLSLAGGAYYKFNMGVCVGDVWEYTMYDDDPFTETKTKVYTVLEVRDGYVRYSDSTLTNEQSEAIPWFKAGATLKERK